MLNRDAYLKLEKPSVKEPVRYFASVEDGLYDAVLNMCVRAGQMCMNEMMHIDMMGGAGVESHGNRAKLEHDNRHAGGVIEAAAPGATAPEAGNAAGSDQPAEGSEQQPAAEPMNHDMHKTN